MHVNALLRRGSTALTWFTVVALVVASMLPLVAMSDRVDAAQVTTRKITMESSEPDLETSYDIDFVVPSGTIGSFRVEFCNADPIPGQACTFTAVGDDVPQFDANAGSAAALNGSPSFGGQAITLSGPSVGDNYLDFTLGATVVAADTAFAVTVDNIDNPSNDTESALSNILGRTEDNNTFYARIYTFASTTPTAYLVGTPPLGNNEGGVAISTANQLTLTARVQEVLYFCVGDTDAGSNSDCTDITGSTVDLGVLDSGDVNVSSTEGATGDQNGYVMVRTNAASGVDIDYFGANLDSGTATITGRTSEAAISAGTEEWGMEVDGGAVDVTNGTTSNLVLDTDFDTDDQYYWGTPTAATPEDLAASSAGATAADRVVDDELLVLDFAASVNALTPTGLYDTTITFVATPTF